MVKAGRWFVDKVNNNPALLPDYEVEIIWQNGGCNANVGKNMLLENWYRDHYYPEGEAERTSVKTVGLLGSGCAGTAMAMQKLAHYQHKIVVSNGATRPALEDRTLYPGFWRTISPDDYFCEGWVAVAKGIGFNEIGIITGLRSDSWESLAKPTVEGAQALGMQLVGPLMSHMNLGSGLTMRGWEMSERTMALADTLVDELMNMRPRPPRFMVLILRPPEARLLFCSMFRKQFSGATFMSMGWYDSFWWRKDNAALPCSVGDMEIATNGTIVANHDQRRADLNTVMTCTKDVTAADFFAYYDPASKDDPRPEGASTADAVCVLALLFHELIYTHGATISDLEHMNQSLYDIAQGIMEASDFEGIQGRFKFVPGSPNPVQGVTLEQFQNHYQTDTDRVLIGRYDNRQFDFLGVPIWLPEGKQALAMGTRPYDNVNFDFGTAGPLENFATCGDGTVLDSASNTCLGCPANMSFVASLALCLCDPGFYSVEGQCFQCPAGNYSVLSGSNECPACAQGKYSSVGGLTQCLFCPAGRYSSTTKSTSCLSCGVGKSAPSYWTTMQKVTVGGRLTWAYLQGATLSADCGCDVNYYLDNSTGECTACYEGMDCIGMGDVLIKPGYFSEADLSVFECHVDPKRCTGGVLGRGMCAHGRIGLTCSTCPDGHFGAACEECEGNDLAPFILSFVFAIFVLCGLYYAIDTENRATQPKSAVAFVLVISLSVLNLQQLGVVSTLAIDYAEPAATIMRLANLLNCDIAVLQLECIIGQSSPTTMYAMTMFIIIAAFCFIVLIHVVRHNINLAKRIASLTSVIGTLFLIALTPLLNSIIAPFECYEHPNDKSTVRRYPTIVCGDGAHGAMVGLGCAFLLIPLGFLAFCAVIVKKFPEAMLSGDDQFLKKWRFLFNRFRAEAYWYILWFMVRNALVALSPMLNASIWQVLAVSLLMAVSLGLIAWFRPWVVEMCSYLDMLSHVALIVVISLSGFFVDPAESDDVGTIMVVFIIANFSGLLIGMGLVIYRFVRDRNKKTWKYFLCHHKGGAGAFCRLLKLQFLEIGKGSFRVWIDCDDLQNLEMLFDYVGSQSANIVINMSKELFKRPWCMGELVTAHLKKVNMFAVRFPDFEELSEDFIAKYDTHVDISCLTPHFISLEMIQAMLAYVRSSGPIVMPQVLTTIVVDELCRSIEAGNTNGKTLQPSNSTPTNGVKVAVVVDHSNWESVSTAIVLVKLYRKATNDIVMMPAVVELGDGFPSTAEYGLFVLSNGAFMNPAFVKTLLVAEKKHVRFLPIIAEDAFRFPSRTMLKEIEVATPQLFAPNGITATPQFITTTVAHLFKEIAVVFSPQDYSSNEALLNVKVRAVVGRVSGGFLQRLDVQPFQLQEGKDGEKLQEFEV